MNIVIAGFGVAGATAAEAARKQNPKAYITLFSREKDLFYYRPRLPEAGSGQLTPDKILAHPRSWYAARGSEVRLGEYLAEVETKERIVRGSMGSRQTYDRLLLAVGAESNRPPLPGDKLDGIFAVRSLNDAWSLSIFAQGKKRAVLIGGGLLGLEMAYALTRQGLEVTVLERGDRILPRQTTPGGAQVLSRQLAALGLEFRLASEADRFEGARAVENVVLKNGGDLPADVVLISAGITPNLNLARALDLKIDQGIVVDDYLETSSPGIYAAGDCARYPGAVGGLWTTSRAQGLTAGANMAAEKPDQRAKYRPAPPSNMLKVAGIDLVCAGDLDPDGKQTGIEAFDDKRYRKVVLDDQNRVVGFTNVGTTQCNKELNAAVMAGQTLKPETIRALADLDYDFAGF